MFTAPFDVLTATASLAGFNETLIRGSQSLGANQTCTFFKVILPWPLSGALVTSLDEVVIV